MATAITKIPRASSGYPLWLGEPAGSPEMGCPVVTAVMAEYLRDCHYRYSTDEEPTTFDGFALRETFQFSDRRFWVWSCTDGFGRTWDVIVGQGRTSVHGATGNALWMHGERNDGRPEPRDLIARDYPEHNDYSGRVN